MTTAPSCDNSVRIGYARVSTRTQDHQAQLDALAAAHCREIVVETASTRGDRPRLREALGRLQPGDTRAAARPAMVRSWMMSRSSSANAAIIVKKNLPSPPPRDYRACG